MSAVGYQYVTLRLVPVVEREEFINVGVVLYSQMADFLDVAYVVDPARIHSFSAATDPGEVEDALRALRAVCTAPPPGMPKLGQRFGWLSAPRSTVIQPGPIHGGVTVDPAGELARLMNCVVRQPDSSG